VTVGVTVSDKAAFVHLRESNHSDVTTVVLLRCYSGVAEVLHLGGELKVTVRST
jgi:hypothetical protein